MTRYFFLIVCFFHYTQSVLAQDKRGNTFIFGAGGIYAACTDTSRPLTGRLFAPPIVRPFSTSTSNICDSATGRLLLLNPGYILYDTSGNTIDNGDNLVPYNIYHHNAYPDGQATQGSLILPKGSNGQYYVFTPTITDSMYNYWMANQQLQKFPFDLLQYHVVDMNSNGGLGKVIQKNIPMLTHVEIAKVGMMACKHANGYDWWLLKQGANVNTVYTFLVTRDTVLLDTIQTFPEPVFGYYDLWGQSCFSSDGSKYAFATGGVNSNGDKLFMADFDRCTGVLSNINVIHAPLHNSNTFLDTLYPGEKDTAIVGLSFSPNDSFLYVAKNYNLYQYELGNTDSMTAWYHVKYGPDTLYSTFSHMLYGADKRIYIGHQGCSPNSQLSIIDSPNNKGSACNYCKLCSRYNPGPCTSSPSNLPNFNMPKKEPCWPLEDIDIGEPAAADEKLQIYPNPSSTVFYIKNAKGQKKAFYSITGQWLFSTYADEVDVSGWSKGVYVLRSEGRRVKVVVE